MSAPGKKAPPPAPVEIDESTLPPLRKRNWWDPEPIQRLLAGRVENIVDQIGMGRDQQYDFHRGMLLSNPATHHIPWYNVQGH